MALSADAMANPRSRPGWLQAGIRFSLPSPVNSDHSLEEVPVRWFMSLTKRTKPGTQLAYRLRLSERLPHCVNPNKNQTNVASIQRLSSRLHNWPVHSVAMSVSSLRSKKNAEQQGPNQWERDDPYPLHDLILNLLNRSLGRP